MKNSVQVFVCMYLYLLTPFCWKFAALKMMASKYYTYINIRISKLIAFTGNNNHYNNDISSIVGLLWWFPFFSHFLCFFFISIRLEGALISGRAGAWAPAQWTSTVETEARLVG